MASAGSEHPASCVSCNRTALVVERETSIRSLANSILLEMGFCVAETDDGRRALSLVQTEPSLDLLVAETQPAGVDGWVLVENFMRTCPLGRVILMTEDEHAETVNVESSGEWLFVPKQHLVERLAAAIQIVGFAHPRRVILLAEDDPQTRTLVETILTRAGHSVIAASDGQEALELSRAYRGAVHLLVSDLVMPHMTGQQLVKRILRERPGIRILLISGGFPQEPSGEYAARECAFLAKPFPPGKLIQRVSALLQEW